MTLFRDFCTAINWGLSDQFFSKYDDTFKLHMLVILSYLFNSIILLLITIFLRFHWMLVTENKTTIENIEHGDQPYWSKYDLGK